MVRPGLFGNLGKASQYHLIAAGSLLGISIHPEDSFPVGKVDFLTLHPLSFTEFLLAMNEPGLVDLIKNQEQI